MLAIGITGNIGSGKTTVCQIFEVLDIPVYYADARAKQLMTEDPELVADIQELLGREAYLPNGQLNRAFVAQAIFSDETKRAAINGLVHPAVGRDAQSWHAAQSGVPYTLQEAALLYESSGYKRVDRMIVVTAPEAIRLRRVMDRDGIDAAAVRARMARQWPEEEKMKRADFRIVNDGVHPLIPQVLDIHRAILALVPNS